MREANIDTIAGFHSLRHSYATACLAMGMNIRELQENLGHSSITTTQIYTHLKSNALREIKKPSRRAQRHLAVNLKSRRKSGTVFYISILHINNRLIR
ncbi:MAG: tyrosine-type recombinase/integrase [Pseudomonadales bacterium]|nr:tyrosine-type recombinase/integrase [Pseudomonadales bacterium]